MSPKPPLSPKTPPLQSCNPRSRIRRAFSKREFIKGKPFTQLLPTFCPLFISPCKYLPCQAFVIQNVFSLHWQLGGFRPVLSPSLTGLDFLCMPPSNCNMKVLMDLCSSQHCKTLEVQLTGPNTKVLIILEGAAESILMNLL